MTLKEAFAASNLSAEDFIAVFADAKILLTPADILLTPKPPAGRVIDVSAGDSVKATGK